MKALILVSLIATSAFASTSTKTSAVKVAAEKNIKSLTLQEIAEKSQTTATLLDQEAKTNTNLSVDNSGRLNNKEEALKLSAENNKTTTTKK